MGKDSRRRRERKKLEEARPRKPPEKIRDVLPALDALASEDLIQLVPRERIEIVIARKLSWSILRTPAEIMARDLQDYNNAVTVDMSRRLMGLPPERHPLHQHYSTHSDKATLAQMVGYIHNQVLIEGTVDSIIAARLHLAAIFPNDLHINDIVLANPGVPAKDPFPGQEYAGLGNGVFPYMLDQVKQFARSHDFDRVTTHAMTQLQADVFMRKGGFQLDWRDAHLARMSQVNGMQVPLVVELK